MSHRLIRLYYWLTPVFWGADVFFGANLRTAGLEGYPLSKAAYYLACILCGLVLWVRPAWTRIVGLTESSVNILFLVLGTMLPYLRLVDQLTARETVIDASPFGVEKSLGLVFSGTIWAIAFHLHAAGLHPLAGAKRKF